jgi:hypothetical protein
LQLTGYGEEETLDDQPIKEEGIYFINRQSLLVLIPLFLITALASITFVWEKHREARWERELNWRPHDHTQIFRVNAGEPTERITVGGRCFRYRTDPHDANVTMYRELRRDERVELPGGCSNTSDCPVISLAMDRPGYVFVERSGHVFRLGRKSYNVSCESILAGWPKHQRPPDAVAEQQRIQRDAEEAAGPRTTQRGDLASSFAVLVSSLASGEREEIAPARDCVATQSRGTYGDALAPDDLSRWVHDGQVTYQANRNDVLLEVLHFDVHDQSCQRTLNRLLVAGLVNRTVFDGARVEEVSALPRGIPPRSTTAAPTQNTRLTAKPEDTRKVMQAALAGTFTLHEPRLQPRQRYIIDDPRECLSVQSMGAGGRHIVARATHGNGIAYIGDRGTTHLRLINFDRQLGSCQETLNVLREAGFVGMGEFRDGVENLWAR